MTGPEHFRRAEQLAAEAAKHLGQGEGQDTAAVWAAVAQVHATLALAAATALIPEGRQQAMTAAFQPRSSAGDASYAPVTTRLSDLEA
jgi:hypothetical protein